MRLMPLLATALLAAACASGPRPMPSDDEVVHLRFGWKAGDRAEVDELRVRRLDLGGEGEESRFHARWQVAVEGDTRGVAVRTLGHQVDGPQNNPAFAELNRRVGELGRLVVGPKGELLEVGGLDQVEPTLRTWAAETFGGDLPPPMMDRLSSMFEVAVLKSREEQGWQQLVAFWSGNDLELQRIYGPDEADLSGVRFRATGHQPCHEGKGAPICVRLEARSAIAGPELDQAVESAVAAIRGQVPQAEPRFTASGESVTLLVEPGTLRPWRFERHREIAFQVGIDEAGNEIPATRAEGLVRHLKWSVAR